MLTAWILVASLFRSGCLTDDDDTLGDSELLTERFTTLGANQHPTFEPSLDLDTWTVYPYGQAVQNTEPIDRFYGFSETEQAEGSYSPHVAKAGIEGSLGIEGGRGDPVDWDTANVIPIRTVTVPSWNAILREGQIDSLWETRT